MERLGAIFAKNLKENRRKRGLTQAGLAEKVDVSTHHIAMIELARHYPTFDLVERIASTLDIETHELFITPHAPSEELETLRREIKGDMQRLFEEFLGKAPDGICKD
jgi:transcriptional regulator with XRE-family HTH domain